jgi:hypothetical protein
MANYFAMTISFRSAIHKIKVNHTNKVHLKLSHSVPNTRDGYSYSTLLANPQLMTILVHILIHLRNT